MQSAVPMKALTLDSSTAIRLSMGSQMCEERALMARNDAWHRIKIVRGARYDKEIILKTILAAVEPADLIPVRYQTNGVDAYFMARNCGTALEKLCRSNLIINIPNGDPIVMIVTLAFASIHDLKINIQPILLAALTRRYISESKYLNLDNLHGDAEIAKTVYCPLSQIKTLGHTLKLAKTALGPFERLNLQHNDLTTLVAMENSNLTSLVALDIRHNNILVMSALSSLKNLPITELWLDGNPLCENYGNSRRYVESAKLYCPQLKRLDGIDVDMVELPLSCDNYYKDDSISRKIVEQFFTHFFDIYDGDNRHLLASMYRKDSLYSMTLGIPPNSDKREKFGPFFMENRNILEPLDRKKLRKLLYRGANDIIGVFKRLPDTLHDRRNFCYDVMHEDHQRILVSVEGIFKTTFNSSSTNPSLYTFSRTFLLIGRENNEYNILNDQLHVVATPSITGLFYKIDEAKTLRNNGAGTNITEEKSLGPREKERMIYTLMDVTTMNTEWCHRFLDDANWDAGRAIRIFMDNYKSSNIPAEAFSR